MAKKHLHSRKKGEENFWLRTITTLATQKLDYPVDIANNLTINPIKTKIKLNSY